jgi:hypothetical protein
MKRGDTIITCASVNPYVGRPDLLDYTSTKGAVRTLHALPPLHLGAICNKFPRLPIESFISIHLEQLTLTIIRS